MPRDGDEHVRSNGAEPAGSQVQGLLKFAARLNGDERKRAKERAHAAVHGNADRKKRRPLPAGPAEPSKVAEVCFSDEHRSSEETGQQVKATGRLGERRETRLLIKSITMSLQCGGGDDSEEEENATQPEEESDDERLADTAHTGRLRGRISSKQRRSLLLPSVTKQRSSAGTSKITGGALTARERRSMYSNAGELSLLIADTKEVLVKYEQRRKTADYLVRESLERFRKNQKNQEPLLESLRQMKKSIIVPKKESSSASSQFSSFRQGFVEAKAKNSGFDESNEDEGFEANNSSNLEGAAAEKVSQMSPSVVRKSSKDIPMIRSGGGKSSKDIPMTPSSESIESVSPSKESVANPFRRKAAVQIFERQNSAELASQIKDLQREESNQELRLAQRGTQSLRSEDAASDWFQRPSAEILSPASSQDYLEESIPLPRHRVCRTTRRQQNDKNSSSKETALTPCEFRATLAGIVCKKFWSSGDWAKSLHATHTPRQVLHELPSSACTMQASDSRSLFVVPPPPPLPTKQAMEPSPSAEIPETPALGLLLSGAASVQNSAEEPEREKQVCSLALSCTKDSRKKTPADGDKKDQDTIRNRALRLGEPAKVGFLMDSRALWANIKKTEGYAVLMNNQRPRRGR